MPTKQRKPSPAERWGTLVNGRLTDRQIFDLFDEFGMAKRLQTRGDYDWARHNLPNIPEEMKKILKIELDKENSARKESAKAVKSEGGQGGPATTTIYWKDGSTNAVPTSELSYWQNQGWSTTKPTTSSASAASAASVVPASSPTITSNPNLAVSASWSTSPSISLVKFTSDPNGADPGDASTVWYVDHSTNTFRPIMSMQALQDMYPDAAHFQAAINSISVVSPQELQPGGQLANFTDLGSDYGIYEKQQAKKLDYNPIDIQGAYGKTRSQDADTSGLQILNSFINFLSSNNSGIDNSYLTKIKNDPATMALYVNALAYGGYTPDDIYSDIKRKQLVDSGNTGLSNVAVISPNISKTEYENTTAGQQASSLPMLTAPNQIGNVSREVWNSPAAQLNDDYYKLTDPSSYDPSSQSFKDAMDAIKPDFYDHVLQSLSAQTEADKSVADSQWKDYIDNLEKSYGYRFSDNALTAWQQLETLQKYAAEYGIAGSGIEQEQQDQALRQTREQNRRLAEQKGITENTQEANQARAAYSSDQIKKLNDEDQAAGLPRDQWRSVKWGLAPNTATDQATFISNFRSTHPDLANVSDAEIKAKYYDPIYDENGNYRSTLYQNQFNATFQTTYGYDPNTIQSYVDKDTNNTVNSIDSYKQNEVEKARLATEEAQQKDITKEESGDYWNPLKGATGPIDYSRNAGATGPIVPPAAQTTTPTTPTGYTGALSTFTPKTGTSYIPDVASMKNYTNIYKDTTPGSTKLYGTLKTATPTVTPTITTPKVTVPTNLTSAAKPATTSVPTGATLISGPSGLTGLTEKQIYRDPNSNKIYKL